MSVLDVVRYMRDHTPKWLMRLNLLVWLALIVPMLLSWKSAWAAFAALMVLNVIVGVRSYARRDDPPVQ